MPSRSQIRAEYKKAKETAKYSKLKDPKSAAIEGAVNYGKCFEASITFPRGYKETCKILKNTSIWEGGFSFIKLKFEDAELKEGMISQAHVPGEDIGVYGVELYKESDSETILIINFKGPKIKEAENFHWKDLKIQFSIKDDGNGGTLFQQITAGNEKDPSKSSKDADNLVKETMGSMLTRFLHAILNPNYFEEEKQIQVESISKNISKATICLPVNSQTLQKILTDFNRFEDNVYTYFKYDQTKQTLRFNSKRGDFILKVKEIENGLLFEGAPEGYSMKASLKDNAKKFMLNRASFDKLSIEFKWLSRDENNTDCMVKISNNQGVVMGAIGLDNMIAAAFDKMAKDISHCLLETVLIHTENNPTVKPVVENEKTLSMC